MGAWTFVTNHGAVLAYIAQHEKAKAIDISVSLGLTERSVRRIIADLACEGYVDIVKDGRVNRYKINLGLPLRRPGNRDVKVQDLLKTIAPRLVKN